MNEAMDRSYVKYDPKKKIPTHEVILPNHMEKEVKSFASDVCVTNEANQNQNPSHNELLLWNFRLIHIGFQHVQFLICTGLLRVQRNSMEVANYEIPKWASCEFEKGHR